MIDLETETIEQTSTEQTSRWRPSAPVLAWAAVLVMIVGVAGAVFFATRDDPATTVAGTPDPQAVVDRYFAAFNAGDADGVVSLLTPDVTLTERFGSEGVFEELDRVPWDQELAGFIAQGAALATISCGEAANQSTEATTVSCDYGFLDAPTQAVGALPVPVTTRFVVTPAGRMSEIQVNYDPADTGIDFLHAGRPFSRWLKANRLEFASLAITDAVSEPAQDCCESMSPTERGLLVTQYAQEWAAYLEANGCTYLDGC